MLSYSLSFYLSRSRRDLLPLFFPPMTSAGKIYADLRTIAIPRENEIYRLESLPRCDIYGKEHDKKHANNEQLSRQISSYSDIDDSRSISNLFKSFLLIKLSAEIILI